MVRNSIIFLSVITILTSSCSKLLQDEKLTLEKIPNNSLAMRLDGYYFREFESDEPRLSIYLFYKNGVILYGNSPKVSEIIEEEQKMRNGDLYLLLKDVKLHWGVYQIDGTKLVFERWYPGDVAYEVFTSSGTILNDSTFHITRVSKPDGSEMKDKDELYHFKSLSPKPDSTNVFIE